MTPAASWDITVEQGSGFQQVFDWEVDGTLIDLESYGFTASAQVRRRFADYTDDIALAFDVELDGTYIIVSSSSDDMGALDLGTSGVWDLEIESDDGAVVRLVQGRARYSREVSRES